MGLEVLGPDEVEQLHQATLRLLEEVGVSIDHEGACHRLADAGCQVKGNRVRIPARLTEESLTKAPASFRLYGSRGNYEAEVGGEQLLTMPLGCAPDRHDSETGQLRRSTSDDLAKAAVVSDWAEHINIFCALFGQEGVPDKLVELLEYLIAVRNCRKPYNASIRSPSGVRYTTEMAAVVAGGLEALKARPTVLYSVCPMSPLHYTSDVVDAIIAIAGFGMPLSFVPMPILGISSPIVLAGSLVQQNAEILSGLVLAYQYRPSLPIMYNGLISPAEMHYATSVWGPPEIGLAGACTAQLARRCGLPCKVYGFGTSSKAPDAQNGLERGMNALMAAQANPSMLGGLGSGADLLSGSLEQLVIDDEIMSRIVHYRSHPSTHELAAALDGIRQAMDGTSFMEQWETVKQLRAGALWRPHISDCSPYAEWQAQGGRTLEQRATDQVRTILEEHKVDALPEDVDAELHSLLVRAEAELLGSANLAEGAI